jgi:hypothetical protein
VKRSLSVHGLFLKLNERQSDGAAWHTAGRQCTCVKSIRIIQEITNCNACMWRMRKKPRVSGGQRKGYALSWGCWRAFHIKEGSGPGELWGSLNGGIFS